MKEVLERLETGLDPAHPAGVRILAYGEISAALLVPGLEGQVAKRMSGFADHAMAQRYCELVRDYIDAVRDSGIRVLDTQIVLIDRPTRPPVVYLVQPLVGQLGNAILHTAGEPELAAAIQQVMDRVWALAQRSDRPEVAIDAQLSNWSFTEPADPVLLDVGTPFVRDGGRYLFDHEILLSAIPPGLRAYYRRKGAMTEYMDDYFQPRLVAVDLLGNFHKESAATRLPEAIVAANEWLDAHDLEPIARSQVDDYYKQDAATLELFLRVRRLDRASRRLFRRDYDFILPGKVKR
ncbi:MAG: hypothetical protein IPG68_03125 [Micrococcales bacterium]|nr:hypothetical protein [Micrococcales bacterium]